MQFNDDITVEEKHMPTPTKYSRFFSSIHQSILQIITDGGYKWTQAYYIESMFSWLDEFSRDLKSIKRSGAFADKNELDQIGNEPIYTISTFEETYGYKMDVSKILTSSLKSFFKEKGLQRFDKFQNCYIIVFSNKTTRYALSTNGHYSDPDFYGTANVVIEDLKRIIPTSDTLDLDKHKEKIMECLSLSYSSHESYSEEKRREIGEKIYSQYGIYGLLYLVLFYSLNGNMPENTDNTSAVKGNKPNIFMASKKYIEDTDAKLERCVGAEKIIMVCYAGTTFLANDTVSTAYKYDFFNYYKNLIDKAEMHIALVDPQSPFVEEMVRYKMKPRTLINNVDMKGLINENIRWLLRLMKISRKSRINLYFVDFSMTLSYFQCIYPENKRENDNIKVDLYLPNFAEYSTDENGRHFLPEDKMADAELRQSFVVKRSSELYDVFNTNIQDILNNSRRVITDSKIENEYKEIIEKIENGEY